VGERNERQRVKRIPEEGAQRPTKLYCVVRRSFDFPYFLTIFRAGRPEGEARNTHLLFLCPIFYFQSINSLKFSNIISYYY